MSLVFNHRVCFLFFVYFFSGVVGIDIIYFIRSLNYQIGETNICCSIFCIIIKANQEIFIQLF